jgi:beta-lactamase regulating signal transducer with metallopeptidase domain
VTGSVLAVLANLGAGALVASIALPLLARISAPRFVHDPASSHRALLWALSLASALLLVPWLRPLVPHGVTVVATGAHPIAIGHIHAPAPTTSASTLAFNVLCVVGAAWSLASALAAALACTSLVQLSLLVHRASPAPAAVAAAVARCGSRGTAKVRRVLVSDEASVPFAAVPWAPVVVLPAAFLETFDRQALELAIEHEATHLDRGDLWATALVRILCVLFPFHPVAARVANDIAFAREAAVDARVSTRDPHRYATLLLDVAARARFDQLPRPVSLDDTALKRRIAMLTDASGRRSISLTPLTITAALLGVAALAAPMPSSSSEPTIQGGPFTVDRSAGGAVMVVGGPESLYAACEGKSAGDRCSTSDFADGTCRTNAENGRPFCAPPPPPASAGDEFALHIMAPDSFYAACEAKSAGDRCSTPEFTEDRTCVLNAENNRLFCAPPPPPADAVYFFRPRAQ